MCWAKNEKTKFDLSKALQPMITIFKELYMFRKLKMKLFIVQESI